MSERTKSNRGVQTVVTLALCAGVMCAAVLLVGAAASYAVVRGWMQTSQFRYAAVIGLCLGAMLGGSILCVRTKGIPILCGVAAGGAETGLCLIIGALCCGVPTGIGVAVRLLAGLAGGALGGILCALLRTVRRH